MAPIQVPLCSYNGKSCDSEDFGTFYDESLGKTVKKNLDGYIFHTSFPAGNCFTFNPDIPAKYTADRPGAQSGLVLLLQSNLTA